MLPWRNPVMLGAAFSFVIAGFGGTGGLISMSYQLDSTIHNTWWITGHFHLIFGGAIVIMYFVIAYDVWPHLTGRALDSVGLMRAQPWTWFVGMIVLTFSCAFVGILGMPRRMAFYDYSRPGDRGTGRLRSTMSRPSAARSWWYPAHCSLCVLAARGQAVVRVEPGAYPVQHRRAPAAFAARGAERLRTLARPDDRADHR